MVPALYLDYNYIDMFYVYVIKSKRTEELYYGFSSDLKERLVSHNHGNNIATKDGVPWELIYYEAFKSEKDARRRELKLKNYGNARTHLKNRLQESLL
jgi:putative endonuclease